MTDRRPDDRRSDDRWETVSSPELVSRIARWLAGAPGTVRVALDGPQFREPQDLAGALLAPLRSLGRPAVHLRARTFWRDASLRFEHGHEDWESYLTWLDAEALRREVLDAAVARAVYVPSLRDPESNRSTREPRRPVAPDTVLMVSGEFLLGRGLPFDAVIHFDSSAAERARMVPAGLAWTLPAHERYERRVVPAGQADVVIRAKRQLTVRGLP